MKIAVDKNNYKDISNRNYEYIYLFDDEDYSTLRNTNLHCIRYDKVDKVDVNTTRFNVRCKKKAKITDDFDALFKKRDYKFGIIVPNFNYEHTLEKCLKSILEQSYKNFEIIYVDDCSTDKSVKIARKLLKTPHKIVELKQKRYNGGARNEAYLHLSQDVDYIYYVDSDDWLFDENVLKDINDALVGEPDVLFVGLAKCRNQITSKEDIPNYKNRYEALEGWSGSCGKVIKKDLAIRQECLYNEGTLKEDKNQHCRICIYMNDFKCLDRLVYVWNQDNLKSITTKRDSIEWQTSTIRHYADTIQLAMSVKGQDEIIDAILEERMRKCKKEINEGGDKQW